MTNPKVEYNTFIRANLPTGMSYDETRNRYVVNNKYRFPTYLQAKWYLDYITKFGFSAAFDPATLFASGEEGAWYDPSDLSTMWTDTGATTQAGVGDEVARIDDKSGNGNHLTQSAFAAQPILRQTAGGLYYLEFDGVDDHFIGDVFTINAGVHAVIGADPDNGNLNGPALDLATSPASSALLTHNSKVFSRFASVDRRDGLVSNPLDPMVVSFIQDGSNLDVSVNRVSAISSAIGMAASATLTFGRSDGLTSYFNGKLFGAVFVNAASQGSEISDTEAYLAAKSGVTL